MDRAFKLLKNRYLIAGVAFLIWLLFFDRYDLYTQYQFQKEKDRLEQDKNFYSSEIERIERAIHDVQYDANEIKRIAREKYQMKKSSEDVYIIVEE